MSWPRLLLKSVSILHTILKVAKGRSQAAFDSGTTRKASITFARRANLATPLPFRSCAILPQKNSRTISVRFFLRSYKIAPETFHDLAGHLVIKSGTVPPKEGLLASLHATQYSNYRNLYYYRSAVHKNLSSKFDRFQPVRSQFDTDYRLDFYAHTYCQSATFGPLFAFYWPLFLTGGNN